jgi:hypothetical protein
VNLKLASLRLTCRFPLRLAFCVADPIGTVHESRRI